MRKTVDLITLISRVNGHNAAPSSTAHGREAVNQLLTSLLIDADVYAGFRYVVPGGEPAKTEDIQSGNYDDTRRRYYVHKELR